MNLPRDSTNILNKERNPVNPDSTNINRGSSMCKTLRKVLQEIQKINGTKMLPSRSLQTSVRGKACSQITIIQDGKGCMS